MYQVHLSPPLPSSIYGTSCEMRDPALFFRGRFGVMIIGREPGARWPA